MKPAFAASALFAFTALVLGCSARDADGPAPLPDGGATDAGSAVDAGTLDERGPSLLRTEVWAVRTRLRTGSGLTILHEERPVGFPISTLAPTRLRRLADVRSPERSWIPPAALMIADAAWHPSGELSVVLVAKDGAVSLARLTAELEPMAIGELHDPGFVDDPLNASVHETDLHAHVLFSQGTSARVCADGEHTVVAVNNVASELVTYRLDFAGGWSLPKRTVVEPPVGTSPLLPIGGSFDTFGAMEAWWRPLLDVDASGNAYVAVWASPRRIQKHDAAFAEALVPTSSAPDSALDSDVLLTKIDRDGNRVWSRVLGSAHEDEPYAIRASAKAVAVAGRARRQPGFDNTFWDAFVSVCSLDGQSLGTRVIARDASSILLSIDALGSGWVVSGSEGWTQNPDGLSVLSFGRKLLLELPTLDADPIAIALPTGPRHNEVRSVSVGPKLLWYAGSEDGPVMHTDDGDPTQIHASGIVGFTAR